MTTYPKNSPNPNSNPEKLHYVCNQTTWSSPRQKTNVQLTQEPRNTANTICLAVRKFVSQSTGFLFHFQFLHTTKLTLLLSLPLEDNTAKQFQSHVLRLLPLKSPT